MTKALALLEPSVKTGGKFLLKFAFSLPMQLNIQATFSFRRRVRLLDTRQKNEISLFTVDSTQNCHSEPHGQKTKASCYSVLQWNKGRSRYSWSNVEGVLYTIHNKKVADGRLPESNGHVRFECLYHCERKRFVLPNTQTVSYFSVRESLLMPNVAEGLFCMRRHFKSGDQSKKQILQEEQNTWGLSLLQVCCLWNMLSFCIYATLVLSSHAQCNVTEITFQMSCDQACFYEA